MTKEENYRVNTDDLYRRSSQYILWSYTPDQLLEARKAANLKGRESATEKFNIAYSKAKADNEEVFNNNPELSSESLLKHITLEEETKYLSYYSRKVIKAAEFFMMPSQVKATAMSFFKKFYLVNSITQYQPRYVLYTCLFLAAKSENYFISIESFCSRVKDTEPKHVLDLEFIVLQSLKFTLLVHHPFRPLYGFFLDFQEALGEGPEFVDKIGILYDAAKRWLNEYGLLSDVGFLFTPPQIALAAMYSCDRKITERYLKNKFNDNLTTIKEEGEEVKEEKEESEDSKKPEDPKKPERSELELITSVIQRCAKQAQHIEETSIEESTEIEKTIFFILNPDRLIQKRLKKVKKRLEAVDNQ